MLGKYLRPKDLGQSLSLIVKIHTMKSSIILIALFLPLLALCQVQDTTVFQKTETGDIQVVRTLQESPVSIATLVKQFTEKAQSETARYANDIGYTRLYINELTKLRTTAGDIEKQVQVNPLDSINASELYNSSWLLKGGDKPITITFKAKGGGKILWRSDTSNAWRPAVYFGSAIRVLKFNGGKIDLFQSVPGGYCTPDNLFVMKPDGGGKREVSAIVSDIEEPLGPVFYGDGTVELNGCFYRFKQKWIEVDAPRKPQVKL